MYRGYTCSVGQLNINMTPELEADLKRLMRARGFKTKTEAVRIAVREALARSRGASTVDFASWIGLGNGAPPNQRPRFPSDDALWSDE